MPRTSLLVRLTLALAAAALIGFSIVACSPGGGTTLTVQAAVGVLEIGPSTIFRVTVHSAASIAGASHFNLLGGVEATVRTPFGTQVENYVVNSSTITLAIYNAAGTQLATGTLDAANYRGVAFDGGVQVSDGERVHDVPVNPSVQTLAVAPLVASPNGLNVLASGIIPNTQSTGTRTNLVIPLSCGGAAGTFSPGPNDGFFIINDVAIEFNYAFDHPAEFNDILNIKLAQSGRQFSNMQLYFRLPGAGRNVVNAQTGQVVPAGNLPALYAGVTVLVNSTNPFGTATATINVTITPFGPSMLVSVTTVSVSGDCVLGANSFYVQEPNVAPDPDAIEPIGDTFDHATQSQELILLILGDEVDSREQTLTACNQWSVANSGGYGTTIDTWNISQIPVGAIFDIKYDAYSVPDKFVVEYPIGTLAHDTGWRGSATYAGNPLYPGGIAGPGSGQQDGIFTRGAASSFKVTIYGPDSGTLWQYSIRCRVP
jgi:hypothetical protein